MIKIVYCYRHTTESCAHTRLLRYRDSGFANFACVHTARTWRCREEREIGELGKIRGEKGRVAAGFSITRCRSVFKIEFYLLCITCAPFYSAFRIFFVSRSLIHISRRSRGTFFRRCHHRCRRRRREYFISICQSGSLAHTHTSIRKVYTYAKYRII